MTKRVISGLSPPASPPAPVTLVAHYDAANVSRTGTDVTGWLDETGNNDLTVVNGTPQYFGTAVNGLPAVVFDGVDESIELTGTLTNLPEGNADRTVVAVIRHIEGSYAGVGYGSSPDLNREFSLTCYPTQNLTVQGNGGPTYDSVSGELAGVNEWMVRTAVLKRGNLTQYKNLTPISTFAHTYETAADEMIFGRQQGFENYVEMSLAEYYIYDGAIADPELNTLISDLMTKYGIAIGDSTPDAFSFVDENDVPLATLKTSAAITVQGITVSSPITVTGTAADPKYSINGGAATADAGNVVNGDSVQAVHTSSASNSTAVTTVVTIGGISDTYTTTTVASGSDTTPDAFAFTDVTGRAVSTLVESDAITVLGINADTTVDIGGTASNPEWEKNDSGTWSNTSGTASLNDTIKVRLTTSSSNSTALTAVLTLDDPGGVVSDTFSATTISSGSAKVDFTENFDAQTTDAKPSSSGMSYFGQCKTRTANPYGGSGKSCEMGTVEATGNFGQFGCIYNFPQNLVEGDECWFRVRTYFPSGFDFNTGSLDRLKFLRYKTETSTGGNRGYDDIYIKETSSSPAVPASIGWYWFYEGVFGQGSESFGTSSNNLNYNQWQTIEYYVKFGYQSQDSGGNGLVRFWVDGSLVKEITDKRTLQQSTDVCTSFYLFTYWNDTNSPRIYPPAQTMQVDDIRITSESPGDTDSSGNPFIGMT